MTRILVVEDDPKNRADLAFLLRDEGYSATVVESAEEALVRLDADGRPDLLLLDVRLPGMSGVELARRLVAEERLPTTVVISGEASISETVAALELGVHDFIEKPYHRERLLRSIRNALGYADLRRQVTRLETELGVARPILGESAPIAELRERIRRAAVADAGVLILGESGTGKELVADALHSASRRSDRPFLKINCAAIPAQLIESELFGHARGAFTDARSDTPGVFEEAHTGTLLLDEIGDMDLELQARLLRVLEDGRLRRIGERRERQVDVRVLASTHNDLEKAVAEGTFRQDLYFRLARVPIQVPPLRARIGDLPLLFEHFFELCRRRNRLRRRRIDPAIYGPLAAYPWPGNVRELRNLAERLAVLGHGPVTVAELPAPYRGDAAGVETRAPSGEEIVPLREFRRRSQKAYLERVLAHTGGNVTEAARLLGIHRSRLHQLIRELDTRRPGRDGEG